MTNKLTYTIEFEAPNNALAADCIYLIRALKQEAQDRLPPDWAVKLSFALGVGEGTCPTTTPSSPSSTKPTPKSTRSSHS